MKIRFKEFYEFIRFLIIGVSGLVVNIGVYLLLTRKAGIEYWISALIALEISILSNFFLDNLWAFRGRQIFHNLIRKIIRYHGRNIIGVLANYAILLILINWFRVYDIYAYLIGIAVGSIINYSTQALLTWRGRNKQIKLNKN
jgi:dolichol-phosphate mannosyltransferase